MTAGGFLRLKLISFEGHGSARLFNFGLLYLSCLFLNTAKKTTRQ